MRKLIVISALLNAVIGIAPASFAGKDEDQAKKMEQAKKVDQAKKIKSAAEKLEGCWRMQSSSPPIIAT